MVAGHQSPYKTKTIQKIDARTEDQKNTCFGSGECRAFPYLAAIILAVLSGNSDTQILFLAFLCSLLIAVYQIVNFYLGHKLQQKVDQSRTESVEEIKAQSEKEVKALGSGDATPFVNSYSVVESTTELLEVIPREARRDE